MSTEWQIPVVCTDRGRHRRTVITHIVGGTGPDGERFRHMTSLGEDPRWIPPSAGSDPGDGGSRESYQFKCPRCPREVRVNGDRWWTGVRAWFEANADAGVSRLPDLDLSLLS
ncbi:hypothetical protein [Intrasporangium sp.]|uniref:hypothetical protein n=1 Tax=Intrasporangium sp. TaxID=1925024 RepID=UPI0032220A23